jgi:hypothetical protein
MGRTCSTHEGELNLTFRWETPEGKRPLGRPSSRREDHIKMYLRETGCEGVDLIPRGQGRNHQRELVNTVMNLRAPLNAEN